MQNMASLVASAKTTTSQQKQSLCVKFVPQAFNTNKCQQCFNLKEMHSTEALAEFSKSNRKVCKYGYLFVAPPDLELNKTKRWQWRFFIFYDDGELTFSLDENPLTLPQGRINLSKCENILELNKSNTTNNDISSCLGSYPNALCLKFSPPNKDIYIAGVNYEDMVKWREALMLYFSRQHHMHHHHRHHHLIKKQHISSNKNSSNNKNKFSNNSNGNNKKLNDVDDDIDEEDYDEDINLDEEYNNANENLMNDDDVDILNDDYLINQYQNDNSNNNGNEELGVDLEYRNMKTSNEKKLLSPNRKIISNVNNTISNIDDINNTESTNSNSNNTSDETRRLSYKEDDLLRKQRLKENLNQLLIEYKHEEEAQLKKYSKFASNSNINNQRTSSNGNNNRTSLDSSCYKINQNKNSAFSLVVPPNNNNNNNSNSSNNSNGFRPISLPNKNLDSAKNKTNTYSSSSSSSSSSSNSPPKTRGSTVATTESQQQISSHSQIYNKPCLISPRKSGQQANSTNEITNENNNENNQTYQQLAQSTSSSLLNVPSMSSSTTSTSSSTSTSTCSNKSLTIQVRNSVDETALLEAANKKNKTKKSYDTPDNSTNVMNKNELIDLTRQNNNIKRESIICSNISGYLWKSKNSENEKLNNYNNTNNSSEKFWFSLNTNSCNLLYWNEKYDQDLGKFPLGKYELSKCSQLIKDVNNNLDYSFKITFHQNTSCLILSASNKENKSSWCEAIKHTIDHISSNCTRCKPKLVVNPMQSMNNNTINSPNNSNTVNSEEQQPLVIVNNKKCTKSLRSPMSPSSRNSNSLMSSIQASKLKSQENNNNSNNVSSSLIANSEHTSSTSSITSTISYDSLKQKYEKLISENNDLQSKFKLLEQIHLNTINEYEKRQNRLYNQIDEMHMKITKSEHECELLNKKLTQSNKSCDSSQMQIQNLNEHLNKYKETMIQQDKEIEKLNKKLQQITASDNLNQLNEILSNCESKISTESSSSLSSQNYNNNNKVRGWNKEVKNLDSRINDLLSKIKEREKSLIQVSKVSTSCQTTHLICDDESYKSKCDQLEFQLQEAQNKIAQLNRNSLSKTAVNLNDFSDDLGKVLMSKEEVITSLEKQLKDREKQVQSLTSQLNEEIFQSNKYQDAFNLELNRNTQLNNEIKALNELISKQYNYNSEIDQLKQDLVKSNSICEKLEYDLNQLSEQKGKLEIDYKNLQEFSKNEIECLQEEIKTFEYKLVHSQRQAQEYQTILEDMDLSNTNSIQFLSQTLQLCGGTPAQILSNDPNTSSLQSRLKRTQSYVQLLIQQIIQIKNQSIDELDSKLKQLQNEFDEIKEENIDLNDHIYSVDVYMREKEAQCDDYQKEKDELLEQIEKLKTMKQIVNVCTDPNQQNCDYNLFLDKFRQNLNEKTNNLNDFIKFILTLCNYFLIKLDNCNNNNNMDCHNEMIISECGILEHLSKLDINTTCNMIDINTFKQILMDKLVYSNEDMQSMRQVLKQLVKFINSSGLTKFNNQIISYMAEQLIHKAALNGHLKFACELLRKKSSNDQQSSSDQMSKVETLKSEQDEKIFKLASELLLSDEDSLRKLSAQLLNEAQHLNQLNCVLNSLNKLRFKNLSYQQNKKYLSELFKNIEETENNSNTNGNYLEEDNDGLNKLISDMNNEIYYQDEDCSSEGKMQNSQLNYILDVIRNIFIQHKEQISEQLNEVHKLMCISSDDDLLAHLQNENASLQQEVSRLKQQINTSTSNKLMSPFSTSSLSCDKTSKLSNNNTNTNWSLNSIQTGIMPSQGLRKFGTNSTSKSNTPANVTNNDSAIKPNNIDHHHFILNDLLSQDDTLC